MLRAESVGTFEFSDEPSVVIVGGDTQPVAAARLEAELRLLGFSVYSNPGDVFEGGPSQWAADHADISAIVFVREDPLRIVMWTRGDHLGHDSKDEGNVLTLESAGPEPESDLLALRAVELLRGLLLEPAVASRRPRVITNEKASDEESKLVPRLVKQQEPDEAIAADRTTSTDPSSEGSHAPWGFFLGPQIAWSPGGVNAVPGFRSAFSRRFLPWFSVQLDGFASAGAAVAPAPGGALSVRAYSLGAGALITRRLLPRFDCSATLGFGVLGVSWQRSGEVSSLDVKKSEVRPRISGEASATYWLYPSAGIRFDGGLTYLNHPIHLVAPHPNEEIPQVDASEGKAVPVDPSVGRAVLVGSAGLELRF